MKRLFRGRPKIDFGDDDDEGTFDGADQLDEETGSGVRYPDQIGAPIAPPPIGRDRGGREPADDLDLRAQAVPEVVPELDRDPLELPDDDYREDDLVDEEPGDGALDAEEFADKMSRLREGPSEQRSAWAYLGVLGGMFCFLVIFGWACSDQRGSEVAGGDPMEQLTGEEPSRLVFRFDGDVVAVQGSVPDEAARTQLLAVAADAYGAENVVDDLMVDPATTLETGTVRYVGAATFGDERPKGLETAVESGFGLANRGFEVGFVETVLDAVNAEVAIEDGRATLTGVLPDEESVADLVAVAGEVWQPANVDSAGLSVGDTTWTDGVIRVTGSTTEADDGVERFRGLVSERIDTLVMVDTAGLTVVDNSELVAEVQTTVDDLVAASPIQFAPNSPAIDAASDELLIEVAEALNRLPDVSFEVVGHTDDVGDDQENLLLSQQRAAAVVERLTELGVDTARMSSRGEGEDNPIADNTTDEGKAANRRIEFILFGTSEIVEPSE